MTLQRFFPVFIFLLGGLLYGQTPQAFDDVDTADQDTTLTIPAPGVLANDTGDAIEVISFEVEGNSYSPGSTATIPGVGTITINADGSWEFVPASGYSGPVPDITYTITGGSSALLLLTVETNGDLLEISYITSCNQGYTAEGYYKINYTIKLRNKSIARDYHPNSLITDIDLQIDLESVFGTGCVEDLEIFSTNNNQPEDFVNNPYPMDYDSGSLNTNFQDISSTHVFNDNAINNNILYPRQYIVVRLCVLVEPFCNGRPNPTPSGSGITFDLTASVTSSRGNDTFTYTELQDFHTSDAIVSANIYLPDIVSGNVADPPIQPDGTYDYTFRINLNNEGIDTAQNVNFNLGMGYFIDAGITFSPLEITQISGPAMTVNPAFNGDSESLILTSGNSLPAGENASFEVHFVTNQIASSDTIHYLISPNTSMTQGPADSESGYDETSAATKRLASYVLWSDTLGDHIDRYYKANAPDDIPTSNDQCHCANVGIRFMYDFNFDIVKTAEITDSAPGGILEHEEVLFTLVIANHSPNIQIINLQIQDNLTGICGGQIVSVTPPQITESTATANPVLNPGYNGITDTNIFDGNSGILDPEPDESLPDQSITVQFSVIFNEDCIGNNIASFSATDPAGFSSATVDSNPVSLTLLTDTDDDGISNTIDIDDDNDGIPDLVEYGLVDPLNDTDGDFIPDYRDTDFGADTNADGIVDSFDFDFDGIPNHLDSDADNDGIPDIGETGHQNLDNNLDAMTDNDVGANGLDNTLEDNDTPTATITYTIADTDADTLPNYLDIDSDADGIPDNIEAQTSLGYIAPQSTVNTAGMSYSAPLIPVDTDGDGTPDYTDDNSDDDIRPDVLEGWDNNSDGTAETVPAGIDSDSDGLDDNFDYDDTAINPTNGQIPQSFPNADNPSTPELDWRELYEIQVVVNDEEHVEGQNFHFVFRLQDRNGNPITQANAPTSASATDIVIEVTSSDGYNASPPGQTAEAPYDYTPVPANTVLTIPAGEVSVSLDVPTYDDIIYEYTELFDIHGHITTGNTLNTDTDGKGSILDNDNPPEISVNDDTVNEGETLHNVFTLSHPCSTPVDILVNSINNTAQSPQDFPAVTAQSLTIPATHDETDPHLEVSLDIPALADGIDEPDEEHFTLQGQVQGGNTSNVLVSAIDTILDIDPPPVISIDNPVVVEGEILNFEITLSSLSYQDIHLDIYTQNGTAIAPGDYDALNFEGVIPALSQSVVIPVPTTDDKLNEDTEYMETHVLVTSFNTENTLIMGTGTIKDNDLPDLFSPDGDGVSDVFRIRGLEDFPFFSLEIYDRWGSKVFEYQNDGNLTPEWWDGTHNGVPAPVGVYYYVLKYNDGQTKPKLGFVELIR